MVSCNRDTNTTRLGFGEQGQLTGAIESNGIRFTIVEDERYSTFSGSQSGCTVTTTVEAQATARKLKRRKHGERSVPITWASTSERICFVRTAACPPGASPPCTETTGMASCRFTGTGWLFIAR